MSRVSSPPRTPLAWPRAIRHAIAWPGGGAPSRPVVAGAIGLLLAALLAQGLTPRWRAEQVQTDQALRAVVRAAVRQADQARAGRPTAEPVRDEQRLLQALPSADNSPGRIAALLELATRHGLTVDAVRQGSALGADNRAGALPLQRVPLVLAARGPYAGLRSFVAEALQQDDALLLDQLRFSRGQASAPALSADLQWSLLQRLPDPPQPLPQPLPDGLRALPVDGGAVPVAAGRTEQARR